MKITIHSYKAVAEWKWNLPEHADDTCGICRVNFEGTCAKCKYPGDDCPIIIGECTHCFHMVCSPRKEIHGKYANMVVKHCISDWIASEASQGKCPMCRQRESSSFLCAGGVRTS